MAHLPSKYVPLRIYKPPAKIDPDPATVVLCCPAIRRRSTRLGNTAPAAECRPGRRND
jgi:hypothetical protein